eukprot:Rhum_TRINITY_DN25174_c0_g1::Rhum_TRINITY_DN25174_c0_g1_i1::g.181399::m.181399
MLLRLAVLGISCLLCLGQNDTATNCSLAAMKEWAKAIDAQVNCTNPPDSAPIGAWCGLVRASSKCDATECLSTGQFELIETANDDPSQGMPGCVYTNDDLRFVVVWRSNRLMQKSELPAMTKYLLDTYFQGVGIAAGGEQTIQLHADENGFSALNFTLASQPGTNQDPNKEYTQNTMKLKIQAAFQDAITNPASDFNMKYGGIRPNSAIQVTSVAPVATPRPTPTPPTPVPEEDDIPWVLIAAIIGGTVLLLCIFALVRVCQKKNQEAAWQNEQLLEIKSRETRKEERERARREALGARGSEASGGMGRGLLPDSKPVTEFDNTWANPIEPTLAPEANTYIPIDDGNAGPRPEARRRNVLGSGPVAAGDV